MRLHRYVLLIVGALVLAAGGMAAACNGGDDSDEGANKEYFEEILRIAGEHGADVQAAQAAQAAYEAAVEADAGDEEVVRAFLVVLDMSSKSIRAEVADREKVEPPPEIEEAHLDLLTAARVTAKIYEDALESASDAETILGLDVALVEVDYATRLSEVQDRANQACTAMTALAEEAGVEGDVC